MEANETIGPERAADRLAGEFADVEASISLVSDGAASSVTLTGMRFGQQLAERLGPAAERLGIRLETTFWPDDSVCDIHVVPADWHAHG